MSNLKSQNRPTDHPGHARLGKKALFITCTDANFSPTRLTGIAPERLFELRNMGNIVPKSGTAAISSETAAIQYVLSESNLRDVILCGHSRCVAVSCLLSRHNAPVPPAVKRWLSIGRSRVACEDAMGKVPVGPLSQAAWDTASRAHLAVQLAHLLEYAELARRHADGELRIHGWFFNSRGRVETLPVPTAHLTTTA